MFSKAPLLRPYPGFDLPAIAAALRRTQAHFDEINRTLRVRRDPLDTEVVENLVEGYAFVDTLLRRRIDLFAPGGSQPLLEINRLVLCGSNYARRQRYAAHLLATEQHFYEEYQGGVGDLVEWVKAHSQADIWNRAAGVYVRILSKPQLFIEGNHRSGTLVVSYVLGREGLPPFVLSPDNAVTYFGPSALITNTSKSSLSMLFRMPTVRKCFARLLKEQSRSEFLLPDAGP
jgi:hypothetical protein